MEKLKFICSITEKVLFLKKSFSENSGTISEMGFISVRVLMTKVR